MISRDDDGSEIRTTGEDFLTDEGDQTLPTLLANWPILKAC